MNQNSNQWIYVLDTEAGNKQRCFFYYTKHHKYQHKNDGYGIATHVNDIIKNAEYCKN